MVPISLRYLLDRIQHPRSRADELAELRARFALEPGPFSSTEQQEAQEMKALRKQISALLGGVSSCAGCNRAHPRPAGPFAGGYCCSSQTFNLFSEDEIAALKASGVQASMLRAPPGGHHGCVFRGEEGCSLPPERRPNICVRYLCVALELELARQGRLAQIEALNEDLKRRFEAFTAARAKRLEDAAFAALLES